jgi:uncharacterized membrane protein YoaK (UPF0700 family)
VQSYVPSTHKSQRIHSTTASKTPTTRLSPASIGQGVGPTPIRLEPVLEKNPLLQLQQELRQQKEEATTVPSPVEASVDDKDAMAQAATAAAATVREEQKQTLFVKSSAALSGFTDALCLAQYGCFVNMMTGNCLKLMNSVVNAQIHEGLISTLFLVSYMGGSMGFVHLKHVFADASREDKDAPVRLVAPIVALLFVGADILARRTAVTSAVAIKAVQVPFLAAGFGLVNGAAGHVSGGTIFFALTGHLTKITNYCHECMNRKHWQLLDSATVKSMNVLTHFMGGALVGGMLLKHSSRATSLPVCTILGLLYGTLYAWYAPVTPLARQWAAQMGRTTVHVARRVKYAFAASRRQPALVPILVDSTTMPILMGSNSTTMVAWDQ